MGLVQIVGNLYGAVLGSVQIVGNLYGAGPNSWESVSPCPNSWESVLKGSKTVQIAGNLYATVPPPSGMVLEVYTLASEGC